MALISGTGADSWRPTQGHLQNVSIQLATIHAFNGLTGFLHSGVAYLGPTSTMPSLPIHGKVNFLDVSIASKYLFDMGGGDVSR